MSWTGELIKALPTVWLVLGIIFGLVVVFAERRNPAVTWAWLMVITLIPYVGFIIYLLVGLDSRKYKVFAQKAERDIALLSEYIKAEGDSFLSEQKQIIGARNILRMPGTEHINDMVYLNFFSGNGAFTKNNRVKLYHDGISHFDDLLMDIKLAKRFIHVQYYIVRDDETGRRLIGALAEKAESGVDVRFIIDGMGCFFTPRRLFKPLIKVGGKLCEFLPPHFIRINFRNHRKVTVIDGVVGYVGGLNVGDEYRGMTKRFGFWRDTHMRLTGEAVRQLQLRFMMDWNFCCDHLHISQEKLAIADKYFPRLTYNLGNEAKRRNAKRQYGDRQYGDRQPNAHHAGVGQSSEYQGISMQIVSSGPDTAQHNIQHAYLKMISEADKSIYIQTPYFVPDDSLFESLRIAALSGIDVRIMIPAIPDHPFVYWAALSYLGDLIGVGVKCYQYQRGFVHSKILMIDSLVCSVGTANVDIRSLKLNFEINAFIYDSDVARQLENQFTNDIEDCQLMDSEWYNARGQWTKVREAVSRLLSPLL